jgi:hypothetical protein
MLASQLPSRTPVPRIRHKADGKTAVGLGL